MNIILQLSAPASVRAIDTSSNLHSQLVQLNVARMSPEEAPNFEGLVRLLSNLRRKAAHSCVTIHGIELADPFSLNRIRIGGRKAEVP